MRLKDMSETNKRALMAIAEGKNVEILKSHKWELVEDLTLANPISMPHWTWRPAVEGKPEVKQVDYQALIDSELFISFYVYNAGGTPKSDYVIGKLKAYTNEYYEDNHGDRWSCIVFKEDLRQVVDTSKLYQLDYAGFEFIDLGDYTENHNSGIVHKSVILLQGVQEGYTL